jgi:hypothetical protein
MWVRTIVDFERGPPRHYPDEVIPMRREATRSRPKAATPPAPTVRLLLQDIADGIRVLQTRDGIELSNEQILERARNIVTGLLGNYRIRDGPARSAGTARRSAQPRPSGPRLTAPRGALK